MAHEDSPADAGTMRWFEVVADIRETRTQRIWAASHDEARSLAEEQDWREWDPSGDCESHIVQTKEMKDQTPTPSPEPPMPGKNLYQVVVQVSAMFRRLVWADSKDDATEIAEPDDWRNWDSWELGEGGDSYVDQVNKLPLPEAMEDAKMGYCIRHPQHKLPCPHCD